MADSGTYANFETTEGNFKVRLFDKEAPKTVANNVSNILAKLQLAERGQAIVAARDAGLGRRPDAARERS